MTLRWRRESGANSSLKWDSRRPGNSRSTPTSAAEQSGVTRGVRGSYKNLGSTPCTEALPGGNCKGLFPSTIQLFRRVEGGMAHQLAASSRLERWLNRRHLTHFSARFDE